MFLRTNSENYIINSLLDIDFYKFTMGQIVFRLYPDVPVKYALKNRTVRVNIADYIREEDLRRELDHARELRFGNTDLHYLRGTNEYGERMFKEDYLEFLKGLQLPEYHLEMSKNLVLEFSGRWSTVIYWETIALAIVNGLYYRSLMSGLSEFEQDKVYASGMKELGEKIRVLKQRPEIVFSDFGTRRRFSFGWHDYVVKVLSKELPRDQFRGTSNTLMAMNHGLLPMGTCAHEMFMVMSGIMHGSEEEIRASHNKVLRDWWNEYNWGLSIALADTFGSDFFFKDMTREQAIAWKGLRQDSGDPIEFGEKAIKFYESHRIDPKDKLIVFSDGLDVETMIKIVDSFRGRIKVSFGWGTNLTNDLGFGPLSLVVKIVEANGNRVAKLGDNLAKAIGDLDVVERYKKLFGYTGTTYEECRY